MDVIETRDQLSIRGERYRLEVDPAAETPQARLLVDDDQPVADLRVVSGCDADGLLDEPLEVSRPEVVRGTAGVCVRWSGRSRLWSATRYELVCAPAALRYTYAVTGHRRVDRARYFGWAERGSRIHASSIWSPQPNSHDRRRFAPGEASVIGLTGDKRFLDGYWFFTPAPYCFVLDGVSAALGIGVVAGPGERGFTEFESVASDGLQLALRYHGHTEVCGEWVAPSLVVLMADEPCASVAAYCGWLRDAGYAPRTERHCVPSWREPIFCGWGEQVNLAAPVGRTTPLEAGTTRAADFATQANYTSWLRTLSAAGLEPGTVVIDDKWQRSYGLNDIDLEKWPDLPAFVAEQHAHGRRVVLWLKAWAIEALPAESCLVNSAGEPLAADPSAPAYERQLRASLRHLLVDVGVDGFKVDFTHRLPDRHAVRSADGSWGVDLLHRLLAIIHSEAHNVRPDALVIAHAANPWFTDVVDMLRLNDLPRCVGQPKSYLAAMHHRARVAAAVDPTWPIDTDNWPSPDRASFLEYVAAQPCLGVPALYYVSAIRWQSPGEAWLDQPLQPEDYAALRRAWSAYRSRRDP